MSRIISPGRRLTARFFRDVSIQRKLTLLTLVTSGAALLLAGVSYLSYDLLTFRQAVERDRLILAQIVGSNSTGALAFDDPKAGEAHLASLSAQQHIVHACLYGKDGKVFATYHRDHEGPVALRADECPVPERGHLAVSQPIILDGEPLGVITIESDLLEFYARLGRYASIGALAIVVSAFVGWRLSLRLQQAISTPILHLVKTARAVSEKMDYSVRAVKHSADEVGLLIDGFNEMLAQIEKRDVAVTELSKNLNQLYRLSTALQEPLSLREQIDRVLEGARQVVAIDRFYIWTVASEKQTLTPLGGAGFSTEELRSLEGVEIPLTQAGAMYKSYQEGISLVFNDANPLPAELRLKEPYSQIEAIHSKSFIVIPMIARGRPVGLFTADNMRSGQPIDAQIVDLLQVFVLHAAVAIQNAELFREIEAQGEQLAIASRHKSAFLANMSHELRTPLNAIIGYSEMLHETAQDEGQDEILPDLEKIRDAGRHLLGLINDILDLSKIEAGKMEVYLEDVDLAALAEEVRAIIEPLAAANANRIEIIRSASLGTLYTDRTKLKQSLLNLLSNASKFTHDGHLSLEVRVAGPAVSFIVSDTGIGMTEEQLGRLFQAFSQADASTTKKYGGTGLGLAISKQFCEMLGGTIAAESVPGQGSTFTITLPDQPRPAPSPALEPEAAPAVAMPADADQAALVMVVDDDPDARDLLVATVRKEGYRVVEATDGEVALALARKCRPDVITLDVLMPRIDGWAVLTALKSDPDLSEIPVIIVTVLAERGIALSLGAAEFMTKPVDRARLAVIIRQNVHASGTVLVVDDEVESRRIARRHLDRLGWDTAEASDGAEALAWLSHNPRPAMILLDLMMPTMDGFAFLEEIAKHDSWREIPVVILTAMQLGPAERELLAGRAREVLAKGADNLAAAMRRTLLRPAKTRDAVAAS